MKFNYKYLQSCAVNAKSDPNYALLKDELLNLSNTEYIDFNTIAEEDLTQLSSDICKVSIQDLVDNPSFCTSSPCDSRLLTLCKFLDIEYAFISVGIDNPSAFAYSAFILPIDEQSALPTGWEKSIGHIFSADELTEIKEDQAATAAYHTTTESVMPLLERLTTLCLNGIVVTGFTGWMDE